MRHGLRLRYTKKGYKIEKDFQKKFDEIAPKLGGVFLGKSILGNEWKFETDEGSYVAFAPHIKDASGEEKALGGLTIFGKFYGPNGEYIKKMNFHYHHDNATPAEALQSFEATLRSHQRHTIARRSR